MMAGDGHVASFCVVTWLLHHPILKVSAWKNAMGAMAKMRPWQKDALEKCHGGHAKKRNENPERNPFRAAWCLITMNHHDSS